MGKLQEIRDAVFTGWFDSGEAPAAATGGLPTGGLPAVNDAPPPPPMTVADAVEATPGPALSQISVTATAAAPQDDGSGKVSLDFAAIYSEAGLEPPPLTAEAMAKMIGELPATLPIEQKREIVKSMLAIAPGGTTVQQVVGDAGSKVAALTSFEDACERATAEDLKRLDEQIEMFTREITTLREQRLSAEARLRQTEDLCITEALRLQRVVEFFGEADPAAAPAAPPAAASS